MVEGMEGSHRAAEAQHCGKTGEVQSADAACGAVTVPRLKESEKLRRHERAQERL